MFHKILTPNKLLEGIKAFENLYQMGIFQELENTRSYQQLKEIWKTKTSDEWQKWLKESGEAKDWIARLDQQLQSLIRRFSAGSIDQFLKDGFIDSQMANFLKLAVMSNESIYIISTDNLRARQMIEALVPFILEHVPTVLLDEFGTLEDLTPEKMRVLLGAQSLANNRLYQVTHEEETVSALLARGKDFKAATLVSSYSLSAANVLRAISEFPRVIAPVVETTPDSFLIELILQSTDVMERLADGIFVHGKTIDGDRFVWEISRIKEYLEDGTPVLEYMYKYEDDQWLATKAARESELRWMVSPVNNN